MSILRKKITRSIRSWAIFILSLILTLSLYTCSTKNLLGTDKVGSIFVNSNVPGAIIWLDNNPMVKQTPDTLKNIKVGNHMVSVKKEGYNSNPKCDTVEVTEGGFAQVTFSLTNQVGGLYVSSEPSGAKIILDHENTQKVTPDTLDSVPVGTHVVSVEKEGYKSSPDSDAVEIMEDSLVSVNFVLVEKLGDLFVNSHPSGAEIILDHDSTGRTTPDTIFDLLVGNHVVSVTKFSYSVFPDSATVEVIEDSIITIDFTLSQDSGGIFVNSTPPGAVIYLNQQNSGNLTPDSFYVPVGSYTVSVAKSGYSSSPESAAVTVVKDFVISVDFALTQRRGSIFVNSDPAGGNIILDHVSAGKTTPDTIFDLAVGEHIITVTKDGYLPSPDSLVAMVTENQTSMAEFVLLDTLYGSLKVTSNVDGATICIDNKPTTEVTPHSFLHNVPVGTHIISIFREWQANENPAKEVVRIAPKDTAEVNFVLTPADTGQTPGNITPDFELQDDYSIWHRYYAYRGFVTMINFWAVSCHYCMLELDSLQRIYQDYLVDTLLIFGINYEDDFNVIRQVRSDKQLTFTLLKGAGTTVKKDYGVVGTPVTIILNRDGRIYYYKIGFSSSGVEAIKFRQRLNELFGK